MGARRLVLWAVLLVLGAASAGCGPARGRYDAVSLGMTADKVKEFLGTPTYQFADEWVYTQDDPRDLTMVTVRFQAGRVVGKSWQNPARPEESHREGPEPN